MAKTSQKRNKAPTKRQMEAARILTHTTLGKQSQKEALLAVGYSEAVASNPQHVWSTKGVQEALTILGLRPDTLVGVAADALDAKQTATYRGEVIESDLPDHKIRLEAMEKIAKISGLIKDQPSVNVNDIKIQMDGMKNFDFDI